MFFQYYTSCYFLMKTNCQKIILNFVCQKREIVTHRIFCLRNAFFKWWSVYILEADKNLKQKIILYVVKNVNSCVKCFFIKKKLFYMVSLLFLLKNIKSQKIIIKLFLQNLPSFYENHFVRSTHFNKSTWKDGLERLLSEWLCYR